MKVDESLFQNMDDLDLEDDNENVKDKSYRIKPFREYIDSVVCGADD